MSGDAETSSLTEEPLIPESSIFDVFFYGYKPKLGDVVVEVGAGVGYETSFISDWVGPEGRVIAVEPNPVEFDNLLTRIQDCTNVVHINAAALDYIGEASLLRAGQRSFIHEHETCITVQALTLDVICMDLPVIDFLKMNIEGSEVRALRGFSEGLQRTANVMVSCHDFMEFNTRNAVWNLLEDAGFKVFRWEEAVGAWARDYVYGRR